MRRAKSTLRLGGSPFPSPPPSPSSPLAPAVLLRLSDPLRPLLPQRQGLGTDLLRSRYTPLEPFEHYEHGKDADPSFPNLLSAGANVENITSSIGAEVSGIQLSQLNDAGKNELALFIAQKKVVAFRDQDFAKLPIDSALEYVRYFGRLHIHPTSGAPEGYPEVHLVHRGAEDQSFRSFFDNRTNSIAWHSDVTYENQPPGTTFLYALDVPDAGGDTIFANQAKAYERLSPAFRERLEGLKALHSGYEQAQAAEAKGTFVRREPVSSVRESSPPPP